MFFISFSDKNYVFNICYGVLIYICLLKKVKKEMKIGVIGLGYVGLPLARLFSTKYATIGFDINKKRILELNNGIDTTLEVSKEDLQKVFVNFCLRRE